MEKKCYIFDFDNTLVKSLPLCFTCFRIVFRQYVGEIVPVETIEAHFGPSEAQIVRNYLREKGIEETDEAVDLFYFLYQELHDAYIPIDERIAAIKKLLVKLKDQGAYLALFTGKGRHTLAISLEKLGMSEYFDVIMTDDDVTKSKPNSEGLEKILKTLNLSADDAAFFGDSDADILAAKQIGMASIGVHWYAHRNFTIQPTKISEHVQDWLDD